MDTIPFHTLWDNVHVTKDACCLNYANHENIYVYRIKDTPVGFVSAGVLISKCSKCGKFLSYSFDVAENEALHINTKDNVYVIEFPNTFTDKLGNMWYMLSVEKITMFEQYSRFLELNDAGIFPFNISDGKLYTLDTLPPTIVKYYTEYLKSDEHKKFMNNYTSIYKVADHSNSSDEDTKEHSPSRQERIKQYLEKLKKTPDTTPTKQELEDMFFHNEHMKHLSDITPKMEIQVNEPEPIQPSSNDGIKGINIDDYIENKQRYTSDMNKAIEIYNNDYASKSLRNKYKQYLVEKGVLDESGVLSPNGLNIVSNTILGKDDSEKVNTTTVMNKHVCKRYINVKMHDSYGRSDYSNELKVYCDDYFMSNGEFVGTTNATTVIMQNSVVSTMPVNKKYIKYFLFTNAVVNNVFYEQFVVKMMTAIDNVDYAFIIEDHSGAGECFMLSTVKEKEPEFQCDDDDNDYSEYVNQMDIDDYDDCDENYE